jgi:hypothetical protein
MVFDELLREPSQEQNLRPPPSKIVRSPRAL